MITTLSYCGSKRCPGTELPPWTFKDGRCHVCRFREREEKAGKLRMILTKFRLAR